MIINVYAAWLGFLLGCIAGAIPGLFFNKPEWLGGYASWPRRLLRLGHISFFGIGFLNLGLALTHQQMAGGTPVALPSILLIIGAVTMPAVCYLSAWRPGFRHLFPLPATAVTLGVGVFFWRLVTA